MSLGRDLLALDCDDLRSRPLVERPAALSEPLVGAGPHLGLSEHHVGDGAALLQAACAAGLEGVSPSAAIGPTALARVMSG